MIVPVGKSYGPLVSVIVRAPKAELISVITSVHIERAVQSV